MRGLKTISNYGVQISNWQFPVTPRELKNGNTIRHLKDVDRFWKTRMCITTRSYCFVWFKSLCDRSLPSTIWKQMNRHLQVDAWCMLDGSWLMEKPYGSWPWGKHCPRAKKISEPWISSLAPWTMKTLSMHRAPNIVALWLIRWLVGAMWLYGCVAMWRYG